MEKIPKQAFQIFLCMKYLQDFVHYLIWKESSWLDMIGIKNMWKRLEKLCHENQISFHQCKGFLDPNLYPNHSIHKPNANPSVRDLKAAPKSHNQVCIFSRKFKNWNHDCKGFQGRIVIPLHSWGFKEGVWIKIIVPNTKKR